MPTIEDANEMETIGYDGVCLSEQFVVRRTPGENGWESLDEHDKELLREREMEREQLLQPKMTNGGLNVGYSAEVECSGSTPYVQPGKTRSRQRMHVTSWTTTKIRRTWCLRWHERHSVAILLAFLCVVIVPVSAVLVPFENCLSEAWQNDLPLRLQFIPEFVEATFDTANAAHGLEVLAYINVNGTFPGTPFPPPPSDTDYWQGNDSSMGGKIVDVPFRDGVNKKTTASTSVTLLSYEPYHIDQAFCDIVQNGSCPLAPRFDVNE